MTDEEIKIQELSKRLSMYLFFLDAEIEALDGDLSLLERTLVVMRQQCGMSEALPFPEAQAKATKTRSEIKSLEALINLFRARLEQKNTQIELGKRNDAMEQLKQAGII